MTSGGGAGGGAGGTTSGGVAGGMTSGGSTSGGVAGGMTSGGSTSGGVAGGMSSGGSACSVEVASAGIFVDPQAGSDSFDGLSAISPKASVENALIAARASGLGDIYLHEGVYSGTVTAMGGSARLIGGWTGQPWSRSCPRSSTATRIQSVDGGPAFIAIDAGITLMTLQLTSLSGGTTPVNTSGASRVGLMARNAQVSLVEVSIRTGNGLPGGLATNGIAGGLRACNGIFDCQTGADGAPQVVTVADAGGLASFTLAGYQPGDGRAGSDGSDGFHGVGGLPGAMRSGCTLDCSCPINNCTSQPNGTVQSEQGTCGCGGRRGTGGAAGRGGGASVGVLAIQSAIQVSGVTIETGIGGNGSAGGAGGLGGTGAPGLAGAGRTCFTEACRVISGTCGSASCARGPSSTMQPIVWVDGGAAGSPGGRGGIGQSGGGGSGGPSIAIVLVSSTLTRDGGLTTLVGGGGLGAAGAPGGISREVEVY
jgi:hypothetical protein